MGIIKAGTYTLKESLTFTDNIGAYFNFTFKHTTDAGVTYTITCSRFYSGRRSTDGVISYSLSYQCDSASPYAEFNAGNYDFYDERTGGWKKDSYRIITVLEDAEVDDAFSDWWKDNTESAGDTDDTKSVIKAGTYRFNDDLTKVASTFAQPLNFITKVWGQSCLCDEFTVSVDSIEEHMYHCVTFEDVSINEFFESRKEPLPSNFIIHNADGWRTSDFGENIKTITVLKDTEVDETFGTWFTENTQMLIKACTYRFNDVLVNLPPVAVSDGDWLRQNISFTVYDSVNDRTGYCSQMQIGNHATDGNELYFEVDYVIPQTDINAGITGNYLIYRDGWIYDTDLQTITITEDTIVSVEFGTWFKDNANPVIKKPSTLKEKLENLIEKANNRTYKSDTDLTSAVNSLIFGYGSGSCSGNHVIEVDELPTENINENVLYKLGTPTLTNVVVLDDTGTVQRLGQLCEYYYAKTRPTENIVVSNENVLPIHLYYIEDENDVFVYLKGEGWVSFSTVIGDGDSGYGYKGVITNLSQASEMGYYCMMSDTGSYHKYNSANHGYVDIVTKDYNGQQIPLISGLNSSSDFIATLYTEKTLPTTDIKSVDNDARPMIINIYYIEDEHRLYTYEDGEWSEGEEIDGVITDIYQDVPIETVWLVYKDGWTHYPPTDGTLKITENGTYDVTNKETVSINVPNDFINGVWEFNLDEYDYFYPFWFGEGDCREYVRFTGMVNGETKSFVAMESEVSSGGTDLYFVSEDDTCINANIGGGQYWNTEVSPVIDFGTNPQAVSHTFKEFMQTAATRRVEDVTDPSTLHHLCGIQIKSLPKTEYKTDEELDVSGGIILCQYTDGLTQEVEMTNAHIVHFDTSIEGKNKVEVQYTERGITAKTSYEISVGFWTGAPFCGIYLSKYPKSEYIAGEWLETNGGVINEVYTDGEEFKVSLTNHKVYGFTDCFIEGDYLLKVKHSERDVVAWTTYKISVANPNDAFSITTKKVKLTRWDGSVVDEFDAVFPLRGVVTETGVEFTDYGADTVTHTYTWVKPSNLVGQIAFEGVTNCVDATPISKEVFLPNDSFTMYHYYGTTMSEYELRVVD